MSDALRSRVVTSSYTHPLNIHSTMGNGPPKKKIGHEFWSEAFGHGEVRDSYSLWVRGILNA